MIYFTHMTDDSAENTELSGTIAAAADYASENLAPENGDFLTDFPSYVVWIETDEGDYLCPDPDEAESFLVFSDGEWKDDPDLLPEF